MGSHTRGPGAGDAGRCELLAKGWLSSAPSAPDPSHQQTWRALSAAARMARTSWNAHVLRGALEYTRKRGGRRWDGNRENVLRHQVEQGPSAGKEGSPGSLERLQEALARQRSWLELCFSAPRRRVGSPGRAHTRSNQEKRMNKWNNKCFSFSQIN